MNTRSSELIQKYLLAIMTEEEVRELENRLRSDTELQHEFLLQAEIDSHLRQEAQSFNDVDASVSHQLNLKSGRHANTSAAASPDCRHRADPLSPYKVAENQVRSSGHSILRQAGCHNSEAA